MSYQFIFIFLNIFFSFASYFILTLLRYNLQFSQKNVIQNIHMKLINNNYFNKIIPFGNIKNLLRVILASSVYFIF